MFDFYTKMYPHNGGKTEVEAWQTLVHVCRRWRTLVFESPRRLNLQLYCTPYTPARNKLDVWPALPLIIEGLIDMSSDMDNVIVALKQSNRVRRVLLDFENIRSWQLEEVLASMQVPFPELTDLEFSPLFRTPPPAIPDSFLGGSAPRLRHFELFGIPFPGLPKLLLSTTHLLELRLFNIPHSGYISPEAMATLLSMLPNLRLLFLKFRSPDSHPDWESRSLPPSKRSILPAFRQFHFQGVTEYLEDLVTHIDTPQLDRMHIKFFTPDVFDCPRLAQFINRTLTRRALDKAHMLFDDSSVKVTLQYLTPEIHIDNFEIGISCSELEPDWQLSFTERVCSSILQPLSTVEVLYIELYYRLWEDGANENTLWLGLLRPFTAVKNLFLCKELAPHIAGALQELVGGRITEVLPGLQNIFVEGFQVEPWGILQENIAQFIVARQLSGHVIAISDWNKDSDIERT